MKIFLAISRLLCMFSVVGAGGLSAGNFNNIITRDSVESFARSPMAQNELRSRLAATGKIENIISYNDNAYFNTTVLQVAISLGLGMVQKVLDQGAEITTQDSYQQTALHSAVALGDLAIVDMLLKKEAETEKLVGPGRPRSVDIKDYAGATPLLLAIERGHTEIAKRIIHTRPNFYAVDQQGRSALHIAVLHGNLEIARALLLNSAPLSSKDKGGLTPEHLIFFLQNDGSGSLIANFIRLFFIEFAGDIERNHEQLLTPKSLMANRKEPEIKQLYQDFFGAENTQATLFLARDTEMLFYEIKESSRNRVQELLWHGRPNVRHLKDGMTPLIYALNENEAYIALDLLLLPEIDFSYKNPLTGWTALTEAASRKNMKLVLRKLLELGAEVNALDIAERSPLMHAADGEIVSLLLEKGAHITSRDKDGNTALHHAIKRVNIDESCVKALVAGGARVTERNNAGQSPLDLLNAKDLQKNFSKQFDEMRAALTTAAAQEKESCNVGLDDTEEFFQEELHRACLLGNVDQVRALLNDPVTNKYIKNSEQKTALHIAADNNFLDVVKLFLENPELALLAAKDNRGFNAFHYAVRNGNLAMMEALYEAEIDIHSLTNENENALHFAVRLGKSDVVKYLLGKFVDIFVGEKNNKPIDIAEENSEHELMGMINEQEEIVNKLVNAVSNDDKEYMDNFYESYKNSNKELLLAEILRSVRNQDGQSLIQIATDYKSMDVMVGLVENGAEFYCKYNDEELEKALFEKYQAHAKEVEYNKLKIKAALFLMYQKNELEKFKEFVSNPHNKADINSKFINEASLLQMAVLQKRVDWARELIALGIDIYAKDKDEKTVLEYIFSDLSWNGFYKETLYPRHQELKSLFELVENGLRLQEDADYLRQHLTPNNRDARNSEGKTLLMVAARHGDIELMKMLMEYGLDKYAADYHGVSVSDWVFDSQNPEAQALTPILSAHTAGNFLYNIQYERAPYFKKLREERRQRAKNPGKTEKLKRFNDS